MDFTLKTYKQFLLTLKESGYSFCTFEQWCEGNITGKFVILRHDIDNKPQNALNFAKMEYELGIKASYYFRISTKIFKVNIIKEIESLGHEIGYHYRDLVDASGNVEKAIISFIRNLTKLRSIVKVKTISMDGCPWSKFDNRDLWKTYNYRDYGIIGEPYFNFLALGSEVLYFTDTARMWNGDKYNVRDKATSPLSSGRGVGGEVIHSTFDFINWITSNSSVNNIMITTHPQRWTDNKIEWLQELVMQFVKNGIKRLFIQIR